MNEIENETRESFKCNNHRYKAKKISVNEAFGYLIHLEHHFIVISDQNIRSW